jgi:formylglycine-generating enzyme required for sulfatase activity
MIVLLTGIAYGSWWAAENGVTPRDGVTILALRVGLIVPAPEMVSLEGGTFMMGSTEAERNWAIEQGDELEWVEEETPQHKVTVPAFAIGKYEVTFDQWELCVVDGDCTAVFDQYWGRGRRPVINISWHDADAYVNWLSRITGETYRLPSEAEWEYAARAGTDTFFWWGDEPHSGHANFGDRVGKTTTEVGTYSANPWGLYDMNGNVWEWVEDCWNDSYQGAPQDGSAWLQRDCLERVVPGGSWIDHPWFLRSAGRYGGVPDNRVEYLGFRVSRTLTP